ncbi:DUF6907 domain-containing protein [Streptomyces cavernicola]|uniref:Uncharacterized protein n=1 Tax=Streptomyces cavernicola TaxID=3043613 RepID=A0ABT6SEQ0_9ACTN|nr:hypothetical protein [Streptomyces sp. B-S-A6]MDI3406670.1 hypothetical protein [Streptomyces sp. B-S-A6]
MSSVVAAETVEHYPSPNHPLEIVPPCPPWCQYRDWDEHNLTGLLRDYFHASHEHVMELGLHTLSKSKVGLHPETLELAMVHMPYTRLPQIDVTVGGSQGWGYAKVTFEEADELRARLSEFLALGREYAPTDEPPTCQELMDYCGARVVEHPFDAPGFHGHAVGDTKQGGPVWVTLPQHLTQLGKEECITHLLAEVHEVQGQDELVSDGRGRFAQAGRPPGAPGPLVVSAAA